MNDSNPGPPVAIPDDELTLTFAGSSGPGGQHVNKTATRAELRWRVEGSRVLPEAVRRRFVERWRRRLSQEGILILRCQSHRSQAANARACRRRLAAMVAEVWDEPPQRRPTRPTVVATEKRLAAKRRRGETKRERGQTQSTAD